jgi:trehalose synthase
MLEVDVPPRPSDQFESVLSESGWREWQAAVARSMRALDGRTVWNVNATSRGGGVAEMLWSLIAYARGIGIDTRWLVLSGDAEFFRVTKRIHNMLHGSPGDGLGLSGRDRDLYLEVSRRNAAVLAARSRPGDIVLLHDPQTAGITAHLPADRLVVWRSHIGIDAPDDVARAGWAFLTDFLGPADAYVFTRRSYAPPELDTAKLVEIPPSIDAFSPKNQQLTAPTVRAILETAGLVGRHGGTTALPGFVRSDGTVGLVSRRAALEGPRPPASAPLVLQISRWDRLKDHAGVVRGFVDHVAGAVPAAHLMCAGPATSAVADDPEGEQTLAETRRVWASLPADVRQRVHLAALPMDDPAENAAMVNALQRHAAVVVQKSLAEGFGLTVAEAMWKRRPVVASAVGAIQDQIEDGVSGVLLRDPSDLAAFGASVHRLLSDPDCAERIGTTGRERVRSLFLTSRHLMQYEALFAALQPGSLAAGS